MSLKLMAQVWEHPHLQSQSEKFVLICLADFASDEGICWPRMDTVARKCCLTEEGARGIIQRLQKRGFLTVEHRPGRGRSNIFHLHPEAGVAAPETPPRKRAPRPQSPRAQKDPGAGADISENGPGATDERGLGGPARPQPHSPNTVGVNEIPQAYSPNTNGFSPEKYPNPVGALYKGEPSSTMYEPSERAAPARGTPGDEVPATRGRQAPIDLGGESQGGDSRYHSPHYAAVLEACDLDDALLRLDPRKRALAAQIAAALAGSYSPEQLRAARGAWPYPIAPTLKQFATEIKRLLNRKEVIPDESTADRVPARQTQRDIARAGRQNIRKLYAERFGG